MSRARKLILEAAPMTVKQVIAVLRKIEDQNSILVVGDTKKLFKVMRLDKDDILEIKRG